MIVNYNNCLFIISSVLSVVCAAPVEESPNTQDESSKVEQYQPQYPFVLDRPFNPAFAYGPPFIPPSTNVQSGVVYLVDLARQRENNPGETNEINNEDDGVVSIMLHTPEDDRSYDTRGDRKKRDVGTELENDSNIPDESKVGKLRKKRTFCRKCGGGYGGGYRPQVYYPIYGGGGGGCNTCGGGGGYRPGGGGGGSWSQSSSSSQSSSGGWGGGYGKK